RGSEGNPRLQSRSPSVMATVCGRPQHHGGRAAPRGAARLACGCACGCAPVVAVLLVCSLSQAGAIFLMLELATPLEGFMRVSSGPLREILGFKLSGKLHGEDYKQFVPMVDEAIAQSDKVRLLAKFHDFHGWDLHALWD